MPTQLSDSLRTPSLPVGRRADLGQPLPSVFLTAKPLWGLSGAWGFADGERAWRRPIDSHRAGGDVAWFTFLQGLPGCVWRRAVRGQASWQDSPWGTQGRKDRGGSQRGAVRNPAGMREGRGLTSSLRRPALG